MFTDRLAAVSVLCIMSVSVESYVEWLAGFPNVPSVVAIVFTSDEIYYVT